MLSKETVQQIWDVIEDKKETLDLNMRVSKGRYRLIEGLWRRMKKQQPDHLSKVKSLYKKYREWRSDAGKSPYLRDVARMMQISVAMMAELAARLKEMSEHKRKQEEEAAAAAAASQAKAPIKKYDDAHRPREAHQRSFGNLAVGDEASSPRASGNGKTGVDNSKPQTKQGRKREHSPDKIAHAGHTKQHSRPAKKGKNKYIPFVHDWKCGKCGYWNKPWSTECSRKTYGCNGTKEHDVKFTQPDDGEHEKYANWNPDKPKKPFVPWFGDWQCGTCDYVNVRFDRECRGEDKKNENPEYRKTCIGKKKDAKYVQEDDGKHEHHFEPEFIGDWWCEECAKWKPVHVNDCTGCGNNKAYCCSNTIQKGPGKKERSPHFLGWNHYRKPGFC